MGWNTEGADPELALHSGHINGRYEPFRVCTPRYDILPELITKLTTESGPESKMSKT